MIKITEGLVINGRTIVGDQYEQRIIDNFSAMILSVQNAREIEAQHKEYIIELLSDQLKVELQAIA